MADIGYGFQLKLGDAASPEVFTALAEAIGFSGPGQSMDAVETTHAISPNAWKTFISGLLDSGEVTLDLAFLPADGTQDNSTGLISKMVSRALANFRLIFPNTAATEWRFSALVTGFEPTAPIEDRMTASVSLKISGEIVYALVIGDDFESYADRDEMRDKWIAGFGELETIIPLVGLQSMRFNSNANDWVDWGQIPFSLIAGVEYKLTFKYSSNFTSSPNTLMYKIDDINGLNTDYPPTGGFDGGYGSAPYTGYGTLNSADGNLETLRNASITWTCTASADYYFVLRGGSTGAGRQVILDDFKIVRV